MLPLRKVTSAALLLSTIIAVGQGRRFNAVKVNAVKMPQQLTTSTAISSRYCSTNQAHLLRDETPFER